MSYFVYILASRPHGTLYVGVTNDLVRRVYEHRMGVVPGFTQKYGVRTLVYYEVHDDIGEAILREKRIKRWARAWKVDLIEKENEDWHDLWPGLAQPGSRYHGEVGIRGSRVSRFRRSPGMTA
ncbi:MAG: GIY-YIG nuclease family protein [Rhizobiales bacterium]|nr:GIY-YIG nuclease family protein [Hyphomicrobiales bacterium]